ncbi:Flp pilus assembly protein CpaB [Desulfobacula sp.]|uniref:Flp pilus assembly protein CpaB n=1 Tax=Desulfobacula sp. TaxID=2593537 RepID=UPI0025C444DE|nr:Flp pilus assembly protein CpaB [Desulfobacula sp.]MBC2705191.1 Flp pilus assembly protein CpaB [Desulfobacula sp.]
MTNFKAFIPILLSVLIALGGSYFLYKWVKGKTATQETVVVKESKVVQVVVAKIPINIGSRIELEEMVTTVPYLENSLPKGYYSKVSDVVNRIVISPLIEGDPVVEHRLAPTTIQTGGVSAVLKPGRRAVSVRGNNVMGIAGFINPGNRIDVLITIADSRKGKDGETITKIVMEDLYVMAAGRQIVENRKGEAAPVDIYTVEVTPEQAERLTLASSQGKLQFALRGALDKDIVLTKGITVPELLDSFVLTGSKSVVAKTVSGSGAVKAKTTRRRYSPPKKKKKTKVTVEIIKGLALTKKTIKI